MLPVSICSLSGSYTIFSVGNPEYSRLGGNFDRSVRFSGFFSFFVIAIPPFDFSIGNFLPTLPAKASCPYQRDSWD